MARRARGGWRLALLAIALVWPPAPLRAHALDAYVQQTLVSLGHGPLRVAYRIVPGAAVALPFLASVDRDANGVLSSPELEQLADRIARALRVQLDGRGHALRFLDAQASDLALLREGMGSIEIAWSLDASDLAPGRHELALENQFARERSVYLVNAEAPADTRWSIVSQQRDSLQSAYRLGFTLHDAAIRAGERSGPSREAVTGTSSDTDPAAMAGAADFASMFAMGRRHIWEGADHLLFLFALLLPAPLLAGVQGWGERRSAAATLRQVLWLVTAFSVGHSVTLLAAANGWLRVPTAPAEIVVAGSIGVAAWHAITPRFAMRFAVREGWIAGGFGLVHGLAFATALTPLAMPTAARLVAVFAFNLGVEAGQLLLVALVLPVLLFGSRFVGYRYLRVTGGALAMLASVAWVAQRLR